MAQSTIRKAIGAVKDQTTIGIAKVSSNMAPELKVLVVKATSHDEVPADDKYMRDILSLTWSSTGYVNACVAIISKRFSKTHDWIVALKALMVVHRLLAEGHPLFEEEIVYATRRGMRVLNLSDFRDEAHSNSWDHATFVRCYAMYLDEKVETLVYERKLKGGAGTNGGGRPDRFQERDDRWEQPRREYGEFRDGGGRPDRFQERDDRWEQPRREYGEFRDSGGRPDRFQERDDRWEQPRREYGEFRNEGNYGIGRRARSYGDVNEPEGKDQKKEGTPLKEMKPDQVLAKLDRLLRVFDRVFGCRPAGTAKTSRLVLVSLYRVVKESFGIYVDICEALGVLLDRFMEMEYQECVKAFDMYVSAAKMIDELVGFYDWCKDVGIARSSEFPEVQRITDKLLGTLEGFLKEMANGPKSPERVKDDTPEPEPEPEPDMNKIKALPAPENYTPPPPPPPEPQPKPQVQQETQDLVNLRDDGISADDQGNKFALALFSGPANGNGTWESFPSNGEPEVTSAWQTPAAESGKADWELALVESTSNLSRQKAALAGGFDPLLLDGMYDQGAVRQHVSYNQLSGGSASSVALPGMSKSATPILALPAPDGTVQPVNQDPFAASLVVPPPSYVQMADMEKKQQLLAQEQQLWQQYGREGMQGQVSLSKIGGSTGFYDPNPQQMMPYGMPQPYGMPPMNGMGQPGGYYYAPY